MKKLYVAKNSNIDKNYIDSIIVPALGLNMNHIRDDKKYQTAKVLHTAKVNNSTLGRLKWVVLEYENLRILKIYEFEKTVFVLINSNTQLEHTVDNLRGGIASFTVGAIGVIVPFSVGFAVLSIYGLGSFKTLLIATALTATSIAISIQVLTELGRCNQKKHDLYLEQQ